MRRILFILLLLAAAPAFAQAPPAPPTSGFSDLTMADLFSRESWAGSVIRGLLPSASGGATEVQNQRTVVGHIVGWFSGIVFALAAVWTVYGTLVNIIRTASSGQALHEHWHWMAAVRMPLALAFMFPVPPSGVSFIQIVVTQAALLGDGSGTLIYSEGVKAIGPDAVPIATPIVPGTKTIVAALLQNELCRSLINVAANNPRMMPPPAPIVVGTGRGGGAVTWAYSLTPGNASGSPVCGTVTVRQPGDTAGTNIMGVSVDMSPIQRDILEQVVANTIRPAAETAAAALWQTREAAALAPLMNAFTRASDDYTRLLTQAATSKVRELRGAVRADALRSGASDQQRNETRLSALGWAFAGAYSLEFGRLNGATLSLLSNTPVIRPPTYQGLGTSLSRDLAPLVAGVLNWRDTMMTFAATQDGLEVPGGYSDLFSGATPGDDGASVLDRVARSMRFSERVMQAFVTIATPTQAFQDPFASQIQLGHTLILIAMSALGLAAILASTTGTVATIAVSALTLNFSGVAAAAAGHITMQYLGMPIFYGLMCLLVPGMILAFLLPLLPFGIMFAGVTGWFILVLEAWVAACLWMLSHLTFRGAEFHGNGATGYITLANIVFRPPLMIIGQFLGYALYTPLAWFLAKSFAIAFGFVLMNGWLVTNLLGLAVGMCAFVVAHMVAATQCFRMTSLLPHHVFSWANMRPANRVDMDSVAQQMGAIGLAQTLQNIQGGVGSALQSARESGQQRALLAGDAADRGGMDGTLAASTDVVPPARG